MVKLVLILDFLHLTECAQLLPHFAVSLQTSMDEHEDLTDFLLGIVHLDASGQDLDKVL